MTNGRASAPPALLSSTGVSTSVNSMSSSALLIVLTVSDRALSVSATPGVTIISRYRFRYRDSTSVNPWYLSGSGKMALVSTSSFFTTTDSSPLSVRRRCPATPTISPASTNDLKFLNDSG